ncbi:hypothetical protein FGO68_gene10897 [Halteria grandinella]|uniref:Uncharacterized protein n=1 Tax=Halteria grandinella TaxID=5974 RepID=A0A8J8SY65_HALGN|nr:hypothetical protein FGO68_gene10897 [Halteria grandinella]
MSKLLIKSALFLLAALLFTSHVSAETKKQCLARCEKVYNDCYDQCGDDAMCGAEANVCESECGMIDPYYESEYNENGASVSAVYHSPNIREIEDEEAAVDCEALFGECMSTGSPDEAACSQMLLDCERGLMFEDTIYQ